MYSFSSSLMNLQVGSHYNFIETNRKLSFDRLLAYGKRLDIASGTAVRFEPGDCKTVTLVPISGARVVRGGNSIVNGPLKTHLLTPSVGIQAVENELASLRDDLVRRGFAHVPEPDAWTVSTEDTKVKRETYVGMFGPTVGDRVRLADTALWVEVEKDFVSELCCLVRYVAYGVIEDGIWRRSEVWGR